MRVPSSAVAWDPTAPFPRSGPTRARCLAAAWRTPVTPPLASGGGSSLLPRAIDGRFRVREHLGTGEDLPQTLHSLRVAGDRKRARGGRGGSRDLAGGDVRPRVLVGGPSDSGVLGLAVIELDRAVVDCEVEGRVADEELI